MSIELPKIVIDIERRYVTLPQHISENIKRICKGCNNEFKPHARKQFYCGELRVFKCKNCGKEFEAICNSSVKATCSANCQAEYIKTRRKASAAKLIKICKWCGEEFHPESVRDAYCKNIHYQKCVICGAQFEIDVRRDPYVKTCSDNCRYIYALQHRDIPAETQKLKQTLLDKYGVDNPMKILGTVDKIKATNNMRFNTDWYTQTDEYKERVKVTDLEKYGVDHHLKSEEVINKRIATTQSRYGSDNVFSSEYGKSKVKQRMKELYGVENPSQYFEFKRKATASARNSKLEIKIIDLFINYDIEFEHHRFISNNDVSHEFDFYLPKYKILIDADGLYYHSYLNDPDGGRVNDYYDDIRISLVPEDHMFFLLVEGSEEAQVKELVNILEQIDSNIFSYDSYLFNWCRSIDFPYPRYPDNRMQKDYKHLCQCDVTTYNPKSRLGSSIIDQFHRSIYDAHVGNNLSPVEAWYDDNKLKQVIKNRLIYKNNVNPFKIMRGFNISKICPKISIFNPVLARYLTTKYLDSYSCVFDPFSGYSGRLLGVASVGKQYIGQDLNNTAVKESNQIIDYLNLINCSITNVDILQDIDTEYECLLTCPPYNNKEIYNDEQEFKSCDDWIELILNKYKCRRYVFVVDNTSRYTDHIAETLQSTSHFNTVVEKVIVL